MQGTLVFFFWFFLIFISMPVAYFPALIYLFTFLYERDTFLKCIYFYIFFFGEVALFYSTYLLMMACKMAKIEATIL